MAGHLRTRRHLRWRQESDERGASLVEFALILPVFALLLFGLIDFGLVFGGYIEVENQVGAAGRAVATNNIPSTCQPSASTGLPVSGSVLDAIYAQTNEILPDLCTVYVTVSSSPLGVVAGSVSVAIDYINGGSETQGSPAVVCARAELKSTTGMTASFLNGRYFQSSSQVMLEHAAVDAVPSSSGYTWSYPASFSCP